MKKIKKLLPLVMVTSMIAATIAGCGGSSGGNAGATSEGGSESAEVLIGSAIYKFDDTFMTGVRSAMEGQAKEKSATLELVDSQNSNLLKMSK